MVTYGSKSDRPRALEEFSELRGVVTVVSHRFPQNLLTNNEFI